MTYLLYYFLAVIAIIVTVIILIIFPAKKTYKGSSVSVKIESITYNNLTIENLTISEDILSSYAFDYSTEFIDDSSFKLKGKSLLKNHPDDFKLKIKIDDDLMLLDINVNKDGTFQKDVHHNNIVLMKNEPTHIPRRLVKTYTGNLLPLRMYKSIKSFMNCNPGYNLFYYNDDDCREFIKEHFSEKVLDAYDSLIPGAYKADIFRLCEIYINGGFYTDISMICAEKLKFGENIDVVLPKDIPCRNTYSIYNAFIASSEKNEVIGFILNEIVDLVSKQLSPNDALSITGPGAVGIYLNKFREQENYYLHKVGVDTYNNFNVNIIEHYHSKIVYNGKIICNTKYPGWKEDRVSSSPHYSILFDKGLIYKTKIINDQLEIKKDLSIYQTWETKFVSSKMAQAIQSFKDMNTDYNHILYTNDMRKEFIYKNYEKDVYNAYNMLLPGAFKADLWRYCLLNKVGGIYCDADAICLVSLKKLIEQIPEGTTFVAGRDLNGINISNGFMYTKPNNLILQECIKTATSKILNKEYCEHDVDLTGPGLVGNVVRRLYDFKNRVFNIGVINKDVFLLKFADDHLQYNGVKFIKFKYEGYDEEREYMGGSNWAKQFEKRKIYRD